MDEYEDEMEAFRQRAIASELRLARAHRYLARVQRHGGNERAARRHDEQAHEHEYQADYIKGASAP